jgi:hypothetical protein
MRKCLKKIISPRIFQMPWESCSWAKVFKSTSGTAWFASKAGASAMLNQTMANGDPVVSWDFPYKVPLCPNGIFCFCQGKSTRNTTYVCINNNTLSQTKSAAEDDVRRFSANSRQGCQFFNRLRNLSVKLINEFATATLDIFGLRSKESRCFYGIFKFWNARCCHFVRVWPPFE